MQNRKGRRTGAEIVFACPNPEAHSHGDAHPSASYNPSKRAWYCHACGDGGGLYDLADRLGLKRGRR